MDEDEKDRILNSIRMVLGRSVYTGKKGEPLTLKEWDDRMGDLEYRRVGYDEIPQTSKNPASYVSTVWLGIDHNFFPNGPPITFETMRFDLVAKPSEFGGHMYHPALEFPDPCNPDETTEQERYSTEEQASIGHKTIVRLIQEREMS